MPYVLLYSIQKNLRLLVACADGYFYIYEVNTQVGGECKLLSQTSILTNTNRNLFSNVNGTTTIGKELLNNNNSNDDTNSLPSITTEN